MKKKIRKKLQNSMVLSERCDRILAVLVCLLVLASAATAETLDDCRDQTSSGQNFTFIFSPVELSDGTDGTFTIHARGDYSVSNPTIEYLTWDIEGCGSGTAAPAYGSVIQIYSSDDVEWEQSFTISGACLDAATSDASVTISLDLYSRVDVYGPSFVCVELVCGSTCLPPAEPNNPDPCDGDVNVPVDTNLSWGDRSVSPPGQIVINELYMSADDWLELFNPTGAAVDLTGWEVTAKRGSDTTVLTIPPFTLAAGAYVVLHETSGSDTPTDLYFDENIFWTESAGSCALVDAGGVGVDFVRWSSSTGTTPSTDLPPAGTNWTGNDPWAPSTPQSVNTLGRDGVSTDTDNGTDWENTCGADANGKTPGAANVGGTTAAASGGEAEFDTDSTPAPTVEPGVRIGDESGFIKEEAAPEVTFGGPGAMSTGGPDCGGYTFIDSDEPGGPSFDWIEISATGTNLNLTDDSYYFPINLPFNFDFYGTIHNQVAVGSNGTVHFVDRYMTLGNQCIPASVSGIDSFIALYWDDLYPSGTGNVYYKIVGSAPNRKLVVQWENVRHYGSSARVTAQAQLFEDSGDILLLYADPSSEAGSGATVGIQRDPTCGLQYLCNQPVLQAGLAILFTRGCCPPCRGTSYDVYFGTDPCAMELIPDCNGICDPNCDPTPGLNETLEECTLYYWQVVAENRCGSTAEGPRWTFTTGRGDGSPCNRDPNCRDAIPSITEIWPPNHKWVDVEILDVIDPDPCDIVSVTITGITQDEPVAGPGSGTTLPDCDGIGTSMARLRAERSGLGDGRVYEISFEASDNRGGVCNGAVQVCVPHSMGRTAGDTTPGRVCIDGGQSYDSTGLELLSVDLNNDGIINVLDVAKLADYWLVSYEVGQ